MSADSYRVDPDDPRAPPQEVWERLTPEERAHVVDSLPSEFPVSETQPPEGDSHFDAKVRVREVLGGFFSRIGRKVYLACELPVYYPGERMFAPDVLAVMDVEPHSRMRWVVGVEGKGLDVALEVHVAGERRKDLERNVERFARLGIREYFIFDRGRLKLTGWRLAGEGRRVYQPIVPQQGFYTSEVLGLELQLEGERLRFYLGRAPLPEADEMIATLERMVGEAEVHRTEEAQLRAELEQRLAHEAQRREDSERKLAEALAELERLRGGPR
ncbi:Uma2 family endonuclease [Archangium gephyra]|uniref:Uma2 family endonuclease n=1 Tax=Archangium gephyra TaxID=48 RepID=UPI003B78DE89